jgi:hypothetical protein
MLVMLKSNAFFPNRESLGPIIGKCAFPEGDEMQFPEGDE